MTRIRFALILLLSVLATVASAFQGIPEIGGYENSVGNSLGSSWFNSSDSIKISDDKYAFTPNIGAAAFNTNFNLYSYNFKHDTSFIDASYILDSIIVFVEGYAQSTVHDTEKTIRVSLGKSFVSASGDIEEQILTASDAIYRFVGATNGLWDNTWDDDLDIRDNSITGFTVHVWKKSTEDTADTIFIDHIQCAVFYTVPDGTYEDTLFYVDTLYPASDGPNVEWSESPDVLREHDNVDEVGAADDGTTFAFLDFGAGPGSGDDFEMRLEYFDPDFFLSIDSIKIEHKSRKTAGTTGALEVYINLDGNVHEYDTSTMTSSFAYYTTKAISVDPETSAAWTLDSLMNAFFGIQVNVDVQSPARDFEMTQFRVIVYWNALTQRVVKFPTQPHGLMDSLDIHADSSNSVRLRTGKELITGSRWRSQIDGPVWQIATPVFPDSARLRLYYDKDEKGEQNPDWNIEAHPILRTFNSETPGGGQIDEIHRSHGGDITSWLLAAADSVYPNWKLDSGDVFDEFGSVGITYSDTETYISIPIEDTSIVEGYYVRWESQKHGYRINSSDEGDNTFTSFHSEDDIYEPFYEIWYTLRPPEGNLFVSNSYRELDNVFLTHDFIIHESDSGSMQDIKTYWKALDGELWSLATQWTGSVIGVDSSVVLNWVTPYFGVDSACSLRSVFTTTTGNSDTTYSVVDITKADGYTVFDLEDVIHLDSLNPTLNNGFPVQISLSLSRPTLYTADGIQFDDVPPGRTRSNIHWFLRMNEIGTPYANEASIVSRKTTTTWAPGTKTNSVPTVGGATWDSSVTANHATLPKAAWTTPGGDFDNTTADTTHVSDISSGTTDDFYFEITQAMVDPFQFQTEWTVDGGLKIIKDSSSFGGWEDTSGTNPPKIIFVYTEEEQFLHGGDNGFWVEVHRIPVPTSTGTSTITGMQGQPLAGLFITTVGASHNTARADAYFGMGMWNRDDAEPSGAIDNVAFAIAARDNNSKSSSNFTSSGSIFSINSAKGQTQTLASVTNTQLFDGIEISWQDVTGTADTIVGIFFGGGAILDAYISEITMAGSSAETDVNPLGVSGAASPSLMFGLTHGRQTVSLSRNTTRDGRFGFGYAWLGDSTHQGSISFTDKDRTSPLVAYQIIDTTSVLTAINEDNVSFFGDIHFDSLTLDEIWVSNHGTGTIGAVFLILSVDPGADMQNSADTEPTSSGTQTLSTDTTTPAGFIVLSSDATAYNTITAGISASIGFASDGQIDWSNWIGYQSGLSPRNINQAEDSLNIVTQWNEATASPTELSNANISAYNITSGTLNWGTADAVARKYIWAAFGNPQGVAPTPSSRRRLMVICYDNIFGRQ